MSTNWADFLVGTEPKVAEVYKSGKNRLTSTNALVDTKIEHPNATRVLVSQIVQKAFPQYANRVNTKITKEVPPRGTVAEYGGLSGDTIKLGKVSGDIETYTYKGKPVTGAFGATSDDVMEGVGIALHELYHARTTKADVGSFKSKHLPEKFQNFLKDADEMGFPSVGTQLFGGDGLHEFLATAVPVTQMREAGMTPTGMWKDTGAKLDQLAKKHPWLPAYIKDFAEPEKVKSIQKAMEGPSLTDRLTNLFK